MISLACSDPSGVDICGEGTGAPLAYDSCLLFEDFGRLDGQRAQIENIVAQSLEAVRALVPIDDIQIRIFAGPGVIPELGIGGFAPGPGEIQITFDPASPIMEASIETELLPLVAHEMHHVMRHRTVGYGSNLLGAMVSEGLADHFSIEIAGVEPPPWSVALTGVELETWSVQAARNWSGSYSHGAWFFGEDPEIPRWAGYAIGFEIVRAYLESNPDQRPSTLFDEPATSFTQP